MRKTRRKGFTLMEVLVAVAIASLTVTAGFRLISMSLRALVDVREEQALISTAQKIHLDCLTKDDMPDSGKEGDFEWWVTPDSAPVVQDLELTFRRLTVQNGHRTMVLYLPE